ncbi:hypothetical protein GOBAR_AA35495 [Gossypium barbadense]|uniref:Arabidopsis retrotransposon Orf1 C-terminal domain-containing protein n=1 Tax=Gossypium barbadense TaxID=3634 RepID=A0A2P5W272_GOSBA|nr:hypothetical protein GOBAR_AA35495 [Gossypium barbadense]
MNWVALEQVRLADDVRAILTIVPWDIFFTIIEPTYTKFTLEFDATFSVQQVMSVHDEPGTIIFYLGGLVRHMSILEFSATLGLYTEEFMSADDFLQLHRHIHHLPSYCWIDLSGSLTNYDASRLKVTSLPPSLRYLHAFLAHTLIGRRESTGVVSTYDAYFLWTEHVFDLAYFIALALHHQTECLKNGPIYLGPYMTRLTQHFGLLDISEQSSTLTLIEDFPNDVPLDHEDPPSPPSSSHRPTHSAASFAKLSKRFTGFEQQCFQRFDSIDATL